MINKEQDTIAYLSMEIALENNIKTYSGGLGVLAGDILKSAATKKFPMVGLTLLSSSGYFKQKINSAGDQIEQVDRAYDFTRLHKLPTEIKLNIGCDSVRVGVWEYLLKGQNNFEIPIYFLDTNIPGNKSLYKELTAKLYGGNLETRLLQEIVFGRGSIKILKALGYNHIKKYHLNEGHGAFAAIELFNNNLAVKTEEKVEAVRAQCVFTTHTPIKTIYDEFSLKTILKNQPDFPLNLPGLIKNQKINTLEMGMYFSAYINGVSKAHQKLLNHIFPDYAIQAITNGVNSLFWTAPEFKKIYDKNFPAWRENNSLLKKATHLNPEDVWQAHQKVKNRLLKYLYNKQQINWKDDILTICFARRFTEYKQPLLLFSDIERLLEILENGKKAQLIFAGKAHPRDLNGQEAIKKIYQFKRKYPQLKIVFLEDYDLDLARLLVAGSDLWLNNPAPPQEACGTSGMKAAHNGVPQISTLDGWWPEGYQKGKTGWAISNEDNLYETLKKEILPLYYKFPKKWQDLMLKVISFNASYFNTDRVLADYIREAYSFKK